MTAAKDDKTKADEKPTTESKATVENDADKADSAPQTTETPDPFRDTRIAAVGEGATVQDVEALTVAGSEKAAEVRDGKPAARTKTTNKVKALSDEDLPASLQDVDDQGNGWIASVIKVRGRGRHAVVLTQPGWVGEAPVQLALEDVEKVHGLLGEIVEATKKLRG